MVILTQDALEVHTDEEGREYCWRVRLYESDRKPAVLVATQYPDPEATHQALMLDTNPWVVLNLLEQIEVSEPSLWWYEQGPGEGDRWIQAFFDEESVRAILQQPAKLEREPAERALV